MSTARTVDLPVRCNREVRASSRQRRAMVETRSSRRRHIWLGDHGPMASPALLELMEDLVQSIEQRDAGDPDAPVWEASVRIQRLEEELARRLTEAGAGRGVAAVASVEALQRQE